MFKDNRILIVAAHPDDEILGLGGTMNLLINNFNALTHVVILGEGLTSRSEQRNPELWEKQLKTHKNNIKLAQNKIGYHSTTIFDFPDNRFDEVPLLDLVKIIEKEIELFKPNVIFTHHGGDLNIDHQKTFEAVITSTRPINDQSVKTIITFETPSSTEWQASSNLNIFRPNLFIGIAAKNLEAKIMAMQEYVYEKRAFPHPRSPEALRIIAERWGLIIGREFAEAFYIVRQILN